MAKKKNHLDKVEKGDVKKIVKNMMKQKGDVKSRDIQVGPTAISTAGTVVKLTDPISLGTGPNDRIGLQVHAESFEDRITIEGGLTQNSYATVRVVIVQDHQDTYSGTPVWTSVFESVVPESPFLYTAVKSKRWTVLFDKLIEVAPAPLTSSSGISSSLTANPAAYNYQFKKKLNHNIMFNDSPVAGKGHLYLLMISDLGAGGSSNPTYTTFSRLYYTD